MNINRRTFVVGGLAIASLSTAASAQSRSPVVETESGRLRGFVDRGAVSFRGIPYGAPTSGANRFRRPQPPVSWRGVRDATSFGNQSPQATESARRDPESAPQYSVWSSFAASEPQSEDCLNLNVWTPALTGARPVMVWLHPGGFQTGAGAEPPTHGANLAIFGDVVVVSVNHRLNAFGYTRLQEWFADLDPLDANPGQLDIVAALRWIQRNIERFGGDPGNVTLFGQSGGGAKICSLMAMPAARGLFHKAICQSGSYLEFSSPEFSSQGAAMLARALGGQAGDLAALQAVPFERVAQAALVLGRKGMYRATDPVLDGAIHPFHPFSPQAIALSSDIPLMIGSTATEATSLNGDEEAFNLDWQALARKWRQPYETTHGPMAVREAIADEQIAAFRAAFPGDSPSDLYFRYSSDVWTILNAITIADRQSSGAEAPVYMYELGFRTPVDGGRWRSPHSLDVPLVFRTIEDAPSIVEASVAARAVSEQMSAAWVAFARTGNPANANLPEWPRYDDQSRVAMVFDQEAKVERDYRRVDRQILHGIPTLRV